MPVKITARIPHASIQYGYWEIEGDTYQEVAASVAEVGHADFLGGAEPGEIQQAQQVLQQGGLTISAPGLAQQQAQPAAQAPQPQTDQYGNSILGVDPLSGQQVKYSPNGKYGPYVKSDVIGNVPKNWNPQQVPSLDQAVQWIQNKRQWKAQQAA